MVNRGLFSLWREVQRVIPVAQTQQQGEVEITMLAIEVYADGCVLTTSLRVVPGTPGIPERFAHMEFMVTMADDRGGSYAGQVDAMRTQSGPDFWQGRAECAVTPALAPNARELRIEIPELRWRRQETTENGVTQMVPGEITPGPWRFTVRFPPAQLQGQQS